MLGIIVAALAILGGVAALALDVGIAPVLSPSMRPTFSEGDLLVVRSFPTAELKVGDVAVLANPDEPSRPFAHRIVELEHRALGIEVRTRGDANPALDLEALLISSPRTTVVIARIPSIGHLVVALGSGIPRALTSLMMVLSFSVAILRAIKMLLAKRPTAGPSRIRHGDITAALSSREGRAER
jgi:signal peptidase I